MLFSALSILLTALFSSALTWAIAYVYFRVRLRDMLKQELQVVQNNFEERVKSGALAAGRELLPQVREQVRMGFLDVLKESDAVGIVENTAGVMKQGADMVSDGISALINMARSTRKPD